MSNKRKGSGRRKRYQRRLNQSNNQASAKPTRPDVPEALSAYPFLAQADVKRYLQHSKVMFLMRGLPGSGKSTIGKAIFETYPNVVICSADDGFLNEDGTYEYDPEMLGFHHANCQAKAENSCLENKTVVIDNTNVKKWEMEPYRKFTLEHKYILIPVIPNTKWAFEPAELATRNKHGVDEEKIALKLKDFKATHPLFYGWFMNDTDSQTMKDLAGTYFDICDRVIPGFISSLGHGEKTETTFGDLYTRSGVLHCTAFFVGSKDVSSAAEVYMNEDVVKDSLGQLFTLRILGLLITPRTVGARVELSKQQLPLWNNDQDKAPKPDVTQVSDDVGAAPTPFLGDKEGRNYNFAPMESHPARKAHLTLGCAAGINPVQTGPDLLKLVALESRYKHDNRYFQLVSGGALEGKGMRARFYGPNDGFIIYFDRPFEVTSIFSDRY